MARFRNVYVYPYSGWPERLWATGRNVVGPFDDDRLDRDAAARSARAITEGLSLQLQREAIQSRRSSYMITLSEKPGSADVEIGPHYARPSENFLNWVLISDGFHHLLPIERAAILAEVVHRSLLPLAESEGWADTLEYAMDRLRADAFECVWASPWKRTPDRRHQVRIVMRIADDGFGRWRVEVGNLEGTVLRESPEIVGWTWVENYVSMAKQMRFDPDGHLVVGRGSMFVDNETTIDIESGSVLDDTSSHDHNATPVGYPGEPGHPLPRVIHGIVPPVTFTGGYGPMSDGVMEYHGVAAKLTSEMESDSWVPSWLVAGVSEVSLPVWYHGSSPKSLVRKAGDRLSAVRYRPPASIPHSAEAARDAARSDVDALIAKVRDRFDMPEPPTWS